MFKSFLVVFVVVFIDDILIYSKYSEDHVNHLLMVLGKLSEHQLFAKLNKFEFLLEEFKFLNHVISKDGVAMDASKIEEL